MPDASRFWVAVAAISLGQALRVNYGEMNSVALALLAFACVSLLMSYRGSSTAPKLTTESLLIVALAGEILALSFRPPAAGLAISPEEFAQYSLGTRILLAAALVLCIRRLRPWLFPIMLTAHAVLAIWTIRHSAATLDVVEFQRVSADALVAGSNPYAITFADPYKGAHPEFYAPGIAQDGRLLFGYPYMPLSLLAIIPAHLAGDLRMCHIAAVMLAALLMYAVAGDSTGKLAASVFLFTPWVFHLETQAWVDALFVFFFALTIYASLRVRSIAPWALAGVVGVKQYGVLALPVTFRLIGPKHTLLALGAIVVTALPFVLWDTGGFLHSAVWLQFQQPWRTDALSFAIALNDAGLPRMPWLCFLTCGVAAFFIWRRADVHPALVARNTALVYLAFFAFAKQAFYNYYFLVLGLLCCALAAAGSRTQASLVSSRSTTSAQGAGSDPTIR
jgi:hypothetical protein